MIPYHGTPITLDAAGVPANPEPQQNAEHGCRIEGRLNYVLAAKTLLRLAAAALEDVSEQNRNTTADRLPCWCRLVGREQWQPPHERQCASAREVLSRINEFKP